MEVRFLASGQILTTLDQDVFDGKTAREVKQTLAAHVGVSRFRQRLFTKDGFQEIHDDEVFGSATMQVQLVVLEFLPTDVEEENHMIDALRRNDSARVSAVSSRSSKSKPIRWAFWSKHVKSVYTPESLKIMWVPWVFFFLVCFLVELGADKNLACLFGRNTTTFRSPRRPSWHRALSKLAPSISWQRLMEQCHYIGQLNTAILTSSNFWLMMLMSRLRMSRPGSIGKYMEILRLAIQEGHVKILTSSTFHGWIIDNGERGPPHSRWSRGQHGSAFYFMGQQQLHLAAPEGHQDVLGQRASQGLEKERHAAVTSIQNLAEEGWWVIDYSESYIPRTYLVGGFNIFQTIGDPLTKGCLLGTLASWFLVGSHWGLQVSPWKTWHRSRLAHTLRIQAWQWSFWQIIYK